METVKKVLIYKLALFKGTNGTIKAGIATFIAGTAGMSFGEMSHAARVQLIAGIILAICIYLDGFIDQTATRLVKGKLPIGDDDGNSKFLLKSETVNQQNIQTNENQKPTNP